MIRDLGLHVVKVLIPGLQPLHAGYRYAALGGERLYQVPRLMGLAQPRPEPGRTESMAASILVAGGTRGVPPFALLCLLSRRG